MITQANFLPRRIKSKTVFFQKIVFWSYYPNLVIFTFLKIDNILSGRLTWTEFELLRVHVGFRRETWKTLHKSPFSQDPSDFCTTAVFYTPFFMGVYFSTTRPFSVQFSVQNLIFDNLVKNRNWGQTLQFGQKYKFWSKIEILMKNRNCDQKLKFLPLN